MPDLTAFQRLVLHTLDERGGASQADLRRAFRRPHQSRTEINNALMHELVILREITRRIGPDPKALLVFAATMVTGLFMVIVRLGGDEPVLEVFMEDVKDRLAQARLGPIEPRGGA